jgi:chromosome segregation ATPase
VEHGMSVSEKAKTTRQIIDKCVGTNKWKLDYEITGSNAPDLTEKWVRLEDAQQEIDDCKASWQNLKDTIPKFDAKISFLETHLKACNKLIDEMQRERGEQKQKLQQFEEFLVAWTENDMNGYIYDYGKKNAHYYPSQDLDLVLDFFFGFQELLK